MSPEEHLRVHLRREKRYSHNLPDLKNFYKVEKPHNDELREAERLKPKKTE